MPTTGATEFFILEKLHVGPRIDSSYFSVLLSLDVTRAAADTWKIEFYGLLAVVPSQVG